MGANGNFINGYHLWKIVVKVVKNGVDGRKFQFWEKMGKKFPINETKIFPTSERIV